MSNAMIEIGTDVYNKECNRMGMVRGVEGELVTVRTVAGLEVWHLKECEIMEEV